MKKTLLTLFALFASTLIFSQVLQEENFNGLNVGNVGTDLTGVTPGQGGWLTFVGTGSTNSNNNNFQIVAEGGTFGNALEITGSNTASGTRFMWKDGLTTAWAARTTGNNIIEVEFDYFTGGTTTSNNSFRVYIYSDEASPKVLAGIGVDRNLVVSSVPYTNVLRGFYHWSSTPGIGTYAIGLGPNATTPFTLPANSWVRLGFSFNVTTGVARWKSSHNNLDANFTGTTEFPPVTMGINPGEIDFVVIAGTGNTVASTARFDNLISTARATDGLLSVNDVNIVAGEVSVYPNPVTDSFQIASESFSVENSEVKIIDINGRTIKTFPSNLNNFNVSELNSGVYFVEIKSNDVKTTKKIIKK